MAFYIIYGELRDPIGVDGDEIDGLVQKRKDANAAKRFFNRLLKGQQATPISMPNSGNRGEITVSGLHIR